MVSPYRPYVAPKPQGPTQGNTGNPMAAQNFGGGWGTTAANPYGWSQVQSPRNQGHAPAPGSETYAAPQQKSPPMYDTMMPARPQQGAQQAAPAATGKPGWEVMMPQQTQAPTPTAPGMTYNPQYQGWTQNTPDIASLLAGGGGYSPMSQGMQNSASQMYGTGGPVQSQGDASGINYATMNNGAAPAGGGRPNDPGSQAGGMTEAQIAARGWAGPSGSGPGGGAASPPPAPGAGGTSNMTGSSPQNTSNLLNIQTVNQETAPIYSDQMIQQNRNQVLANMARVTPESAAKQFETPGMSRSAGTWSAALPKLANFQAGELGNLANQEYGFRNANATNQLDQQYRREMEGLGLANNEFGLQNAYGDMQDQARQRQINLLMSMLQGAGRLNTLGSYGSGY